MRAADTLLLGRSSYVGMLRRDDAYAQIGELKQQAGKEILVFGSRTLWRDPLAHGLVTSST